VSFVRAIGVPVGSSRRAKHLALVTVLVAGVVAGVVTGSVAADALAVGTSSPVVVVPRQWTDPATHVSYDLDPTGVHDVTLGLNLWLARELTTGAVPHGTAAAPTVIRFPAHAQYRVEDGLWAGAPGVSSGLPLPMYRMTHVVLDFNGGRIFQTDDAIFQAGHPVVQPLRRWGLQLLRIRLADDVTVENGTIEGHHLSLTDATYTARASWHGIHISGSSNVVVRNMTVDHVWGDFVDLGGATDESVRPWVPHHNVGITIDNVLLNVNGRQGITINDADGLTVEHSTIRSVERFVFDSEPSPGAVVRHVDLHDNNWGGGRIGFFNMSLPKRSVVGDLVIADNVFWQGHMHVNIAAAGVARSGLTIVGNRAPDPAPALSSLVVATGWSNVTIRGNADHVAANVRPIRLVASPLAVTAPNQFG
jgi:hypothetical protein